MLDIQVIEKEKETEITTIQGGLQELKKYVDELAIDTPEKLSSASDFLKRAKQWIKNIDEARKKLVKPLNDHVDYINGQFKPQRALGEEIQRAIEKKIVAYQEADRKKREEEERIKREEERKKLEAQQKAVENLATKMNSEAVLEQAVAIEEKREKLEAKPIEVKQVIRTETSQTTISYRWTYDIVEPDKVPRELCVPSEGRIRDRMSNMTEEQKVAGIPGLNLYKKPIPVTR